MILPVIALVITGFPRLMDSPETDIAAFAASGAQNTKKDPQSDILQFVAKTITPQSGGLTNEPGSLATDAEATGQAALVMNTLWDTYMNPEQARTAGLSSVLIASTLEEFGARALEWMRDGTRTTGSPTLEDVHILNDDGVGDITVSVYVDSSNVRVLNDAGTVLTDDTTMTRALTYFLLVRDDGVWKLSGFSSPDDPTYWVE